MQERDPVMNPYTHTLNNAWGWEPRSPVDSLSMSTPSYAQPSRSGASPTRRLSGTEYPTAPRGTPATAAPALGPSLEAASNQIQSPRRMRRRIELGSARHLLNLWVRLIRELSAGRFCYEGGACQPRSDTLEPPPVGIEVPRNSDSVGSRSSPDPANGWGCRTCQPGKLLLTCNPVVAYYICACMMTWSSRRLRTRHGG